MKYVVYSVGILIALASVVQASDQSQVVKLGSLVAKKYALYGDTHASSKSFFVLGSKGYIKKAVVYDRRKQYTEYSTHALQVNDNARYCMGIIGDTHLVAAQKYIHGLQINTIGDGESLKNIKLPPYVSTGGLDLLEQSNSINAIHGMSVAGSNLLCDTSYAGCFVIDITAEKIVQTIKDNHNIINVIPNKSGDGFWYATLKTENKDAGTPEQHTIGHYDLRSDKATMSAELPSQIGHVSINTQDTRWAATLAWGNKIHLYDVRAQRQDRPIGIPSSRKTYETLCVDEDTLVYNTGSRAGLGYEQRLHKISLTSGDTEECELPSKICGVHYHPNTGLVIGAVYASGNEIYDFGFKH